MKAMVLERIGPVEKGPLAPAELAAPEPAPGQVRIKVEACGLCHTDLHEIEGELALPKLPLIPGHQVVGRVEKLAAGVENLQIGQRGLYGFGASAHIAIQVARHWGCEVYVFSRSAEHRKLAQQLGAAWTGRIDDQLPKKLHGSIIFAPAGQLVPPALEHLEKAGTCALAGIYMSQVPPLDYEKHLYHEKTLRSVANSTRRDGRELMKLAGEIKLETTTQPFPLEKVNQALQLLKAGKINGAAVLKIE
ncbi:MAG: hypothetical protein AMJ79_10875 [Phycisphaerae bacterium SM23_30]|nr:MAG: hypothetical protein AMJ79_10875 [Phycisphaerae bacterium SM23_30]